MILRVVIKEGFYCKQNEYSLKNVIAEKILAKSRHHVRKALWKYSLPENGVVRVGLYMFKAMASLLKRFSRKDCFLGVFLVGKSFLRGFAKLKKFKKSEINLDRAHPTHPPSSKPFNKTYTNRIHMVYYSKISVLV